MDDVARFPTADRRDLFAEAGRRLRLPAAIVEKDFWVCWTLGQLFRMEGRPTGLLFKGGTSLSKVYQAIDRFSEDVDLSLDRAGLGFGGENDPIQASSGKKARAKVEQLAAECRTVIRESLVPRVREVFTEALGESAGEKWELQLDAADPDGQTVLFRYPEGVSMEVGQPLPAYIQPQVRLELGARADHWPAEERTIQPYAVEVFPDQFTVKESRVRVLKAERTFWEKATILHAWHHAALDKPLRDRQSRHYYDLVCLYEKGIGEKAIQQIDLLETVAEHKKVFFAAAWARYEEAKVGSLRLVPPTARLSELDRDYEKMKEMIFGEPPAFGHLLKVLEQIESRINRLGKP